MATASEILTPSDIPISMTREPQHQVSRATKIGAPSALWDVNRELVSPAACH